MDYDIADKDELNISMMIADGVVCMYVNDEIAFTTRMYLSQASDWGVFSIGSKACFEHIMVCK